MFPDDPPHVPNSVCQDSAKGSRERRAAEEERDAILALPPLIPHGKVVDHAGEQPGLGDTEEESRNKEAGEIVYDPHQGRDDSPCHR